MRAVDVDVAKAGFSPPQALSSHFKIKYGTVRYKMPLVPQACIFDMYDVGGEGWKDTKSKVYISDPFHINSNTLHY